MRARPRKFLRRRRFRAPRPAPGAGSPVRSAPLNDRAQPASKPGPAPLHSACAPSQPAAAPAERDALLHAILQTSDDAIAVKDAAGRYTAVSVVAASMLGRAAEEIVGRTDAELLPGGEGDAIREVDEKVWRTGLAGEHDVILPADGQPRRLRRRASLLRDGKGRPTGLLSVARDDSDRRLPPPADAQLAAIVATSDDAIISKTLDGTIRTWNPGAERMLGWPAAEAVGAHIALIVPPELLEEETDVFARLAAGEHIRHYETVRLAKDGRRVAVSLSVAPVRDQGGRVTLLAKVMRDVTPERAASREREALLQAEHAARAEAERMQELLESQAAQLEDQAVEMEAALDDLRIANEALTAEREVAERATRMLNAVVEQLPVGLYVVEAESGGMLLHNRMADELLGHLPTGIHDLAGRAGFGAEHLDGTAYAQDERPVVRALRGEEVEQEELRYRRPDGSAVELSVSSTPVRREDGRVAMAVCTFLDVSARHAAQRALAEREASLHGFFGVPGVLMMVVEPLGSADDRPDFLIRLANGAAGEWLGGPPEGVVGGTWGGFGTSDESLRHLSRVFAGVRESRSPAKLEFPSTVRPGSWLRMYVSPIGDDDGGAQQMAVLVFDITEEHVGEEQRRKLQLLVEHSTDYIAVTSPDLVLEYVNPAGLALLGAPSLEAVRGRSILAQFDDTARAILETETVVALQTKGHWKGEIVLRHLVTGAPIPVETTAFAVTDPATGALVSYGGVNRPIGERKRLEAEYRQAQKMEAIGRLAGGIAHDFNNLLSVILGYSAMLLDVLPQGDPVRADVDEIRMAGDRAAALTRQLLAFSRQQVLEPRILSLNDVVAGMDKMLRRLIGEDVELLTAQTPGLACVLVDPGQMEQVIMNLAVNSRDAMPSGGKLTIETANVTLGEDYDPDVSGLKAGPHVLLAVTDTGVGMDAATQLRIFEPFFTTKEAGSGTGLGLSTVFGIVKQSGGGIWVYSEPGIGTTVKIYFPVPAHPEPERQPLEVPARTDPGGTETILLVEDEAGVRQVVATILRRYGYHVLDAASGGDALLICEQHPDPIPLLLTDVVMPRMSGPETAARLRPLRPEMRVLFMSGYTDRSIVHHDMLDSDTAFIQKPITPRTLAQKVREVLDAPRPE
ncbi:MAG: hybrid sensor histidine kinase/response regulator [Gemmatimonadetes bacterium]|nr:hybrid sensor histidine kinase/response regulator [Gemmatimonadota bacterium]